MLENKQSQYGKFSNSWADILDSSGPILTIMELIPALMVTHILNKFGSNWLIFIDVRE